MNNIDSKIIKKLELTKNEIVKDIKELHPDFFAEFKTKISSNNHTVILNTIIGAKIVIQDIINKEYNVTDKDLKEYENLNIKDVLEKKELYSKDSEIMIIYFVVILGWIMFYLTPLDISSKISELENEQLVTTIISINQ